MGWDIPGNRRARSNQRKAANGHVWQDDAARA